MNTMPFNPKPTMVRCATALLSDWKTLMGSGLAASRAKRPEQALVMYERALTLARELLSSDAGEVSDDDRVAAFIVTHLNLADCYRTARRSLAAEHCLCSAHRFLLAMLGADEVPPDLQLTACRHLRETHAALSLFAVENGASPYVQRTLEASFGVTPAQLH